jgi:hypothetical protein
LAKFENYLEIPLDSYVGKRLKQEPEGADLPAWKSVKGLTPELSAIFQVGRAIAAYAVIGSLPRRKMQQKCSAQKK